MLKDISEALLMIFKTALVLKYFFVFKYFLLGTL